MNSNVRFVFFTYETRTLLGMTKLANSTSLRVDCRHQTSIEMHTNVRVPVSTLSAFDTTKCT